VDQSQQLADCLALVQSFDTLLLSTANKQAEPLASFSPYIYADGCYYILISELAGHTQNLQENPRASVMFIEAEESARNIYARRRVVVQVRVEQLARDSGQRAEVVEQMLQQHGETVKLLTGLEDFKLFKLIPTKGRYVIGFGKAYEWDVSKNTLQHISAHQVNAAKEVVNKKT